MTATTEVPLTEATLTGSVVTLTLSGRDFTDAWDIADALTFSGIEGIFVPRDAVERVSNTEAKVTLYYAGNIDTDDTFTLTVGADAITSYNEGFSFEFPVTAVEESLVVSTKNPLTEATLYGNAVILTLNGRNFTWWRKDVQDVVTVSGIEGVTVGDAGFYTDDNSHVAVPLSFSGDIHEDATLTLTIEAGAIAGYNEAITVEFSVPAVEESLDISSKFDLTEATLSVTNVTLTLNGRQFVGWESDIFDVLTVSGIDGVSLERYEIDRVSDTEIVVDLNYDGTDFDTDGTLTFTVGADAIAGYEESLTATINVTAIKQSEATVSISPNPIVSPPLSEQLTFNLNIIDGKDVAGFQAVVWYDISTLKYRGSAKGTYLPADAYLVAPTVQEYEYDPYPYVPIAATALDGVSNGNGTLATLTFEVYNDVKESEITLTHVYIVDREGVRWEVEIEGAQVTEPAHDIVGDINRDGIVNIRDLVLAGNRFGLSGENRADLNGDGIVDIADLVLVANELGAAAAAPSLNPQVLEQLTATDVKSWLNQARKIELTDPAYLRGITVLEQLHKALTPKVTALLPNFPNPFNPETWIPYHLSKDADVTLHIYAMNGTLVRTLSLGHQAAGMYQSRPRAAYWDGRNSIGEKVASGVYFYKLTAGEFSATRKMLIRK
ncbi:T9SS type A sorting domain-containing protein [Candidatus Poribacteria bacterium]|nr:T9SS type A sorting domain-containing protein [Candidatus Poribacteria bacterium]MYB65663.1 T9SS type A sorting domain-containing protein [Candidatus Poribacteria bacterium]